MKTVSVQTLIIGAGFGGLCMAAKLKKAGRDDFIILEQADALGGTWRDNTYPGAECDIPSALYSFSFFQNPTWDFKWAKQPQILKYMQDFAKSFDIHSHIRFGETVTEAFYDETAKRWSIKTADGQVYAAQFLVSAVGQLHNPRWPEIKGRESFSGKNFHSARWDHSIDLTGKSVGVIGNAASAVQFIPEIAKVAGELTVYQRSPNWIVDKMDRPYSSFEKWLARWVPGLASVYRFQLWSLGEYFLWPMIKGSRLHSRLGVAQCKTAIRTHIKDKALRRALVPDYPIGAKRVLLSDTYYPALARDNVKLEREPISHITKRGVKLEEGRLNPHDVLIYATGFYTNPFLKHLDVRGENGVSLKDHWKDGAFAYLSVMTAGFPNLFLLYGPNSNTGHTSIIFKLENQVNYCLQLMKRAEQSAVSVKAESEQTFNEDVQSTLKTLAWSKVDASWYKDGERVTNNWPWSSRAFKRRLRRPNWAHFKVG